MEEDKFTWMDCENWNYLRARMFLNNNNNNKLLLIIINNK